jgi:hypothetical protein
VRSIEIINREKKASWDICPDLFFINRRDVIDWQLRGIPCVQSTDRTQVTDVLPHVRVGIVSTLGGWCLSFCL